MKSGNAAYLALAALIALALALPRTRRAADDLGVVRPVPPIPR